MFKLSKDNPDHYILTHKDGHFIKIAKKSLSPDAHKQIKSFCSGGSVKMAKGGQVNPKLQQSNVRNYAEGTPDEPVQPPQQDQSVGNQINSAMQGNYVPSDVPSQSQGDMQDSSGPQNVPPPGMPQSQPQGNPYNDIAKTANQIRPAANALNSGANQEANVIGQQGKDIQGVYDSDEAKQYQQKLSDIETQIMTNHQSVQNTIKEVHDGSIDPGKAWHQKSTGDKILAGIGVLLGGIGSGLTGQPNAAISKINAEIERDIDAQKQNLGQKKTALEGYLHQGFSLDQSVSKLRSDYQAMIAGQIQKISARYAGPMAQATAMKGADAFVQQALQPTLQLQAQKNMLQQQGGQMSPEMQTRLMVPPDKQKEVFNQIDQGKNLQQNGKLIMDAFDRAANENTVLKTGAGYLRTPESILQMRSMMLPVIHDAEGRVNEFEQKTTSDLEPKPGDTDAKIAAKRNALLGFLKQKSSASMAQGYGVNVPSLQNTMPIQATPNYKKRTR